jgi:hypothetical protein
MEEKTSTFKVKKKAISIKLDSYLDQQVFSLSQIKIVFYLIIISIRFNSMIAHLVEKINNFSKKDLFF